MLEKNPSTPNIHHPLLMVGRHRNLGDYENGKMVRGDSTNSSSPILHGLPNAALVNRSKARNSQKTRFHCSSTIVGCA